MRSLIWNKKRTYKKAQKYENWKNLKGNYNEMLELEQIKIWTKKWKNICFRWKKSSKTNENQNRCFPN